MKLQVLSKRAKTLALTSYQLERISVPECSACQRFSFLGWGENPRFLAGRMALVGVEISEST